MSSQTYSLNAFETTLAGGITAASSTMIVNSAAGLTADCYLVIDPDKASEGKHEFVKVTNINVNTLTIDPGDRDLAGSGDGGIGVLGTHDVDAVVRAVPVHQWLDDIFTDINALESDLAGHEGGGDPHPDYLLESDASSDYVAKGGSVMSGLLVLSGEPVADLNAATKLWVEEEDATGLQAAKDYADLLDHDHAGPILIHKNDADAHHDELHGGATHLSGSTPDGYVLTADGAAGSEWRVAASGVTDHGALSGLGDDDHTAYHTNARGDTRYYQKAEVYTKGQVDSLLAALTIPASRVTAGIFGAGGYTFPGALGIAGAFNTNSSVDFSGLSVDAGAVIMRISGNGVRRSS